MLQEEKPLGIRYYKSRCIVKFQEEAWICSQRDTEENNVKDNGNRKQGCVLEGNKRHKGTNSPALVESANYLDSTWGP